MDVKKINTQPKGIITIPPSKSVGHRALICGALSKNKVVIKNIGTNDDIKATLDCIKKLGKKFKIYKDTVYFEDKLNSNNNIILDCKESGSTLRFLIPILGVLGISAKIIGSQRLLERPIHPYIKTLSENGVNITQNSDNIQINGKLKAGTFYLQGDVSSQFITGLLLALPLCDGNSKIILTTNLQSKSYVDITIDVMKNFGVNIVNNNYNSFEIMGNMNYNIKEYVVEADYSGGAFFLVAGALGADIYVSGLNLSSKQGDKKILDLLKQAGAEIKVLGNTIKVTAKILSPLIIDVSEIPDLVPPLAVLLSFCDGKSKIINASRLRLKESDRLETVSSQLNKIGAKIVEYDDYLEIEGVQKFKGGIVNACNDHRIAMMLAVASIKSEQPVYLQDYGCVKKSYPNFWNDFCK